MGEVINLRRVRKAKARGKAEARAAANRAAFGRTLADRQADRAEADRRARELDGARRDR
jgi:hypothetical protein